MEPREPIPRRVTVWRCNTCGALAEVPPGMHSAVGNRGVPVRNCPGEWVLGDWTPRAT